MAATCVSPFVQLCHPHPQGPNNAAFVGCDAQASFCTLNTLSLLIKPNPEKVDCKLFSACQGTKTCRVIFLPGPLAERAPYLQCGGVHAPLSPQGVHA